MKENCIDCLVRTDKNVTHEELFAMTRYVPYRVLKDMGTAPQCFFDKKIEKLFGTAVYLDIRGFTKIVNGYMLSGKDVGDLQGTLSDYYSVVIETVREFGGSVFQFAGDSILICFDKLPGESDEDNMRRAMAAMILTLNLSDNYNVVSEQIVGFSLHPKIGVGFGEFFQVTLGTPERFMTPALTGAAVTQAVNMEKQCDRQEIVTSAEAWALVQKIGLKQYFVEHFVEQQVYHHLVKVPEDFPSTVERPPYVDPEDFFDKPRFYNRMYTFINPTILNQIKSSAEGFAGDYRAVTMSMVHFGGVYSDSINEASIRESYASLNKVYEIIQDVAGRFGAFCGPPDLSDKGTVFPVFFGTPSAIENKERMAVLFANTLIEEEKKQQKNISVSIGISSGVAYAGEFGANMRKDFTIVGNAINFAARLMMKATEHGQYAIFIDNATRVKTEMMCFAESRGGMLLKGFSKEQTVYQIIDVKTTLDPPDRRTELIGREKELAALMALYKEKRHNGVFIAPIVGDAGQGKSYLLEEFLNKVAAEFPDTLVLQGNAFPYESATSFYLWREIIKNAVSINNDMQGEVLWHHTEDVFEKNLPEEANWASYFLDMLGCDFAENRATEKLDILTKQRHFFYIAYTLLEKYADGNPLIIALEDIEWCDPISLHMLEYIIQQRSPSSIFIIPTARERERLNRFYAAHKIKVMRLSSLDAKSAAALAKRLLDFEIPDADLVEQIVAMSDGNPLYIEAIIDNLAEDGTIVKGDSGHYYLAKEGVALKIPYTIQNLVLARLNMVPFDAQVVCKDASVIGRVFSREPLEALLPDTITEEVLDASLDELVGHGLLLCDNARKTLFSFKEAIMRDVIYRTIIDSTKRSLNRTMVEYLEDKNKDNLDAVADKLLYYATESKDNELVEKYKKLVAERRVTEKRVAGGNA